MGVATLKKVEELEPAEKELRATCKGWADEIEAAVSGNLYRCGGCGERVVVEVEVGTCPYCGAEIDTTANDAPNLSIYDVLESELDTSYRVDCNLEYLSGEIYVGLGGPTVHIDTGAKAVVGTWASDKAQFALTTDAVDELDEILRDMYESKRDARKKH